MVNKKNQLQRLLALLCLIAVTGQTSGQENSMTATNEEVIREFIATWSNLDAEELADYFTEDGIYHNIPSEPVRGRENIERFIAGFIAPWDSTEWDIINLLAEGNLVMVERLDRTTVNGNPVDLPCFGIFEMEDGKISVWRDYFDLATYTDALGQALGN